MAAHPILGVGVDVFRQVASVSVLHGDAQVVRCQIDLLRVRRAVATVELSQAPRQECGVAKPVSTA